MYSRKDYLSSTECERQSLARENSGLDWNYAIAGTIDRDLHEKLLKFTADEMLPFADILPLIRSGYFATAKGLVEAAEVSENLTETKVWLIDALTEADEAETETAETGTAETEV